MSAKHIIVAIESAWNERKIERQSCANGCEWVCRNR